MNQEQQTNGLTARPQDPQADRVRPFARGPGTDGQPPDPDRPLRIAVDFDGVLFDHVPYMLRGFRDAYGIDLQAEGLRYWDFFQYRAIRDAGLTWNCVRRVLDQIETDPVLHRNPPREEHARSVITQWRDQGHEVSIVTARQPISREVTELFLGHHDIPYDHLVMGALTKTGYDVLIDDAPHNVLMAAADGGLAILMDHPYNEDVPTRFNPVRAHGWKMVERLVADHLQLREPPRQMARPGRMSLHRPEDDVQVEGRVHA